MSDQPVPKLFISYSWSSPEHQAWVIQTATELMEAGVEVMLDKWDLKEGNDAFAFMEKMVSDPQIKKVILICDQNYATKANARAGGVGAEAQIITPEIYNKQDQNKFVAVIREKDKDGNACVPTYYGSRIYIDLSDPSSYTENFESVIRWIFDKPLYKKPMLGKKPGFLTETEGTIRLATTVDFRRTIDAIKNGRVYAAAALAEYFSTMSAELEKFRIPVDADPFDEAIVKNIEEFLPYRNQIIEVFSTAAIYLDNEETRNTIHRFFQSLVPYLSRTDVSIGWKETDFDNFRFIVQELFLYCIAIYVKNERFQAISSLLEKEFYVKANARFGNEVMNSYKIFQTHIQSFKIRNDRLELNRLSLLADILRNRCTGVSVEFEKLMVSDFILFIRGKVEFPDEFMWRPDTLVFLGRFANRFEIFSRCRSTVYFDKVKIVLGVKTKQDLEALLARMEFERGGVPQWQFESFSPRIVLGFDDIATKP